MNKIVKVVLIFFSSVIALVLAAVIILPFVIDLNDYKSEIEVAVKEQTGRDLSIGGELELSVFPWLGVSTGTVRLSNAAGFSEKDFAVIGASEVKVKLLPLLSKEVEVSTVVLKGLELHLAKNAQGVSNWDDLAQQNEQPAVEKDTEVAAESEEAGSVLAALAIGGLQIEDSQLSWDDQQAGKVLLIKDLNLGVGAIAFNQPIALKLSFLVENSEPKLTEQFSLSTELMLDEAMQKIQLAQLKINSTTKGAVVPGGILTAELLAQVFIDLQQETIALQALQLGTNIIDLSADINLSQFKTAPQYAGVINIAQFSPKSVMQQLKLSVPETTDAQVLQKMTLGFELKGGVDAIALNKLKIMLDDTLISGRAQVQHFEKPEITFNLAVDDIDVDRYSAPKKESAQSAPVTPATAVAAATTLLPVETIRALNLSGDLHVEKLKVAQLKMSGIDFNIQSKKGILQTKQSIKQLYSGRYAGAITVNVQRKTPTISLNEKLNNVQLEPLLKDMKSDVPAKITGAANIAARLSMRGNTIPAIKSTLGGNLNFSVNKGAVRGFNVQKMIDTGKLLASNKEMRQSYANEQTLFSVLQGTATVKQGLVTNPDFLLESSTIEVKGGGTANLVNEALSYKVQAMVKKGEGSKSTAIKGRPIAINVSGTFAKPTYRVDVMSMITEREQEKINKVIDKHLGEGAGKAVNKLLRRFF